MSNRTQKDLFEAAERGTLKEVEAVVGAHLDWVDAKDPDRQGGTALITAAWKGHLPVVEWLAAHGADVNAKDKRNETALMLAADNGHLPVVKWLVAHGANVNAKGRWNQTALISASISGHLPVVEWLATHGADVNAKNDNNYTALMVAAYNGHLPVVELLAGHGADVNAKNNLGDTAVVIAARHSRLPVVECLVAHGADGTTKDRRGRTALDWARGNNPDVVAFLSSPAAIQAARAKAAAAPAAAAAPVPAAVAAAPAAAAAAPMPAAVAAAAAPVAHVPVPAAAAAAAAAAPAPVPAAAAAAAAPTGAALLIPAVDINFDTRVLGRGGFKDVICGRWAGGGHIDVALASLVTVPGATEEQQVKARDEFFKEASMLARLSHPNILRIYGVVKLHPHCGGPVLVMELMETSLDSLLHPDRGTSCKLTHAQRAKVACDIAKALMYLHTNNTAHWDLKPANVLMSRDLREVKLTDFGLSKTRSMVGTIRQTSSSVSTNQMVGTLAFMAPEMFTDERKTHRADLWSLGCMIYEIACLKEPFHHLVPPAGQPYNPLMTLMMKVGMQGETPQLSDLPADPNVWFWREWVEALCKKDPAARAPMATFVGDMIQVIKNGIVEPQ